MKFLEFTVLLQLTQCSRSACTAKLFSDSLLHLENGLPGATEIVIHNKLTFTEWLFNGERERSSL